MTPDAKKAPAHWPAGSIESSEGRLDHIPHNSKATEEIRRYAAANPKDAARLFRREIPDDVDVDDAEVSRSVAVFAAGKSRTVIVPIKPRPTAEKPEPNAPSETAPNHGPEL